MLNPVNGKLGKPNLIFICYGENKIHRYGIRYFIDWLHKLDPSFVTFNRIIVGCDSLNELENLPIEVVHISNEELNEWSLQGKYHFAIKNRALRKILDAYPGPFLYSDADLYPKHSLINALEQKILSPETLTVFRREHAIWGAKNRTSSIFAKALQDRMLKLPSGLEYSLASNSAMWGSAIIATESDVKDVLDDAFDLIRWWAKFIPSHTIEQFALTEAASLHGFKIESARIFFHHYSTSARKKYAAEIFESTYGKLRRACPYTTTPSVKRPLKRLIADKWKRYQS